jgi:hypothetical protein
VELEAPERVRPHDGHEEAARPSDPVPADHERLHDLAYRDRGDGEVVSAQPEHRVADDLRQQDGEERAREHARPRCQAEARDEHRRGVGAGAEEDGMAERDLAAVAGEHVPGLSQHRVEEDHDHHVAREGLGEGEGEGDEAGQDYEAARDLEGARHQNRPNRPCGRQRTTAR